ncbi:hypothetical protein BO70DRAFT_320553 [Aspergillus heteromorphus CBS 117.55]|uniref:F-box domain-containing protein n=1 Tax=Aspergillus heteromorphus CBS 117.55 TaxID=1448321 RepID=A0A317VD64_9EURO|nr:uncharacterized protein BO70DRAFT_320553 [Aspergillus heteromorphus CBS 117.55]PWY72313.1 hypothetical protein BO70DRAFT_320553 [Aspergillus heteromorphus CBS 117.55]
MPAMPEMDVLLSPDATTVSHASKVTMEEPKPHRSDDELLSDDPIPAGSDEEKDDLSISPVSDRAPPWSGTRWARFFPELSSHFSLTSPTSATHPQMSGSHNADHYLHQKTWTSSDHGRASSSLSSEELTDNRSSSYTRRSSMTSQGSEITSTAYRFPDAFPIPPSSVAGGFDESIPTLLPPPLTKRRFVSPPRDKPLPQQPPIELTPLSLRVKTGQLPQIYDGEYSQHTDHLPRTAKHSSRHQPTLSQAAIDLERTLAGLTEHRHTPVQLSPRSPHQIPDGPLQISRGNMDMIATRPAPRPPVSVHQSRQIHKAKSREDLKQTKKPHKTKTPFSFTVPSFGRKQSRAHLRSASSSSVKSEPGSQVVSALQPPIVRALADKDGVAELPGSPITRLGERPASVSSERELRMKLPRLQTKERKVIDRDGVIAPLSPAELPAYSPRESHNLQKKPYERPRGESIGEKYFVSHSKSGKPAAGPVHPDLKALQAPTTVYELDSGSSLSPAELQGDTTVSIPSQIPSHMEKTGVITTPMTFPDRAILSILRQVDSLDVLFRVAVVCKDFYRVFKEHELDLMRSAVFAMSAPAWELREISPPWDTEWQVLLAPDAPAPEYTPSSYLQRYAQDIYTLAHLKSLILARCGTFLRPDTIQGLAGNDDTRATEVDDAFWRVWTFCRIFGSGKRRESDTVGQLDWLRGGSKAAGRHISVATSITEPFNMDSVLFEPPAGFGCGNKGGLSKSQLVDMTEIWTCLGVLLQPLHGRCDEARKVGIFDGHDVALNDTAKEGAVLEEWSHYVLTLGPSAVLLLGSIHSHDNNAAASFEKAQMMGLTKWEPCDTGGSRSSFLREAVSKAYQPPRSIASRTSSHSSGMNSRLSDSLTSHDGFSMAGSPVERQSSPDFHRQRQAAYSAQLRNQRQHQLSPPNATIAEERPLSNYASIMSRLEGAPPSPPYRTPMPEAGASQMVNPNMPNVHYIRAPQQQQQVRDPVDQAIETMVRDLGFAEEDAKWALKVTDNGEGIDLNAAISLLKRERKNQERNKRGFSLRKRGNILSSVLNSPESRNSGWKWA